MKSVRLTTKILCIVLFLSVVIIALGIVGINSSERFSANVTTLYEDRIDPLHQLTIVEESYALGVVDATNKAYLGIISYEEAVSIIESALKESNEKWDIYLSTEMTTEETGHINDVKEQLPIVNAMIENLLKILRNNDREALALLMANELYQKIDPLTASYGDLTQLQLDVAKEIVEESKVSSRDFINFLYMVVAGVSLLAIILSVLIAVSLRTLRNSIVVISGSVQQVATAAAQSGNAISMVADGSKRQSDSINQAVTAVEQSISVLAEVSKSAEEATELAKNAGTVVRNGKEKMDLMVRVVNRIEENSNKVNKITEIIGDIANQTNMLALNAAIEAARAGEQGKGFAVVADQVKSLAESSKSSVEDIVALIEQAKADASEAVVVANNVNQEMEKIMESSKTTERMMQNISTAMEEQVSTTEELGQNMDTLRDIGTSNANAAEEITETIIELSRIASDTNQEIKKFNI